MTTEEDPMPTSPTPLKRLALAVSLAVIGLVAVAGIIALAMTEADVPEALVAVSGAAVGALATRLNDA